VRRQLTAALLVSLCLPAAVAVGSEPLKTRFTYTATVASVPAGSKKIRIWVPVPSDNPLQEIGDLTISAPGPYQVTTETENGNRMVFVETDPSKLPAVVNISFDVSRQQAGSTGAVIDQDINPEDYLDSDKLVPISGRYAELGREVAGAKTGEVEKMRAIYDHVVATMQYDYKKESPHLGEGNVPFVCDYKKGNCSDLHSYVIALARSQGIPAYLEYGFPVTGIPLSNPLPMAGKIGGYHCWTWFYVDGKGWLPLDASDGRRWLDSNKPEIKDTLVGNLVLERSAVAFSRGRDITLNPPQAAPPLNFFIYPYAEANGKPVDASWNVTYELAPPDDVAAQIAQLRQLVLAQQVELDRLKGVAEAPKAAGHKAVAGNSNGEIVSIYGQLRLDAIHDSSQMSPNAQSVFFVKSPDDPTVHGKGNDQFTVYPRLTRVGLNLKAPADTLPGWTISGKIEGDFHGGGSESRANPRARLLYADIKHGGHAWRVGQDWDLISPLWPSPNDDTGQWNAGNTGDRRPQARYTYDKGLGFNAAVAAVLTGAIDAKDMDSNGVRDGEDEGVPGAQARVGWKWKKGSSIGIWGARAWEETTNLVAGHDEFDTRLIGIDFIVMFNKWVDLKGEAWTGSNLSDLRGGIAQGVNTTTGEEIESEGGWIELGFNTCAKHRIVIGYSMDDPDDDDLPNGGREKNSALYLANKIQLGTNFELGINLLDWDTDFKGLESGHNFRTGMYIARKF